jgi:hypothetical protein
MKGTEDARQIERYIALDIHKEYVLAGAVKAVCMWGIWQPETKKQLQMVSIQNRFSD